MTEGEGTTAMEDDFNVIIDSLGNMALSWVPEAEAIIIYPDAARGTAMLEVCLRRDDWQLREAAVDKLVELRSMFLDDVTLDYRFTDGMNSCASEAVGARQFV